MDSLPANNLSIEDAVGRLLASAGCEILKRPDESPWSFDFGIRHEGRRIAIEVKHSATRGAFSGILGYQAVQAREAGYEEIWLVTLHEPPRKSDPISNAAGRGTILWLSLDQLAQRFSLESPADLKVLSVVPHGILRSQLPRGWMEANWGQLEEGLRFGERHDKAVAVMSDIKSFTSIVLNSDGRALNEMLEKYYWMARRLVREHHGTFDKVIGDAVLAVFGYPGEQDPGTAAVSALRFSIDLINEGRRMLTEFFERSTTVTETGTRVALSSGDVWPVNVGEEVMQVSFIGKPINLAARLQHEAEVDGIAISQNTWNWIAETDPDFAQSLNPVGRRIPAERLSGAPTAINIQCISPEAVNRISR